MEATVIFITFETEFSSYGGLGAVMKILPKEMGTRECCVIAPFFHKLIDLDALQQQGKIQQFSPLFSYYLVVRGQSYCVEVIEVVNSYGLRLYFLSSEDFFNASENPYVNPCNPDIPLDPYRNPINPEKLTEDALFFCCCRTDSACGTQQRGTHPFSRSDPPSSGTGKPLPSPRLAGSSKPAPPFVR